MRILLVCLGIFFISYGFAVLDEHRYEDDSFHVVQSETDISSSLSSSTVDHGDSDLFIKTKLSDQSIDPWRLSCTTQLFPDAFIARQYLHRQRAEIQMCTAEQTIYYPFDDRIIVATFKITPARLFFEIQNIVDRHRHAKLIIGEDQRWYSLYTSCYEKSHQMFCLLFPEADSHNQQIIQAMKENEELRLQFVDSRTHQKVILVFSLKNFQTIYPLIEAAYPLMKNFIQKYAHEMFLTVDREKI